MLIPNTVRVNGFEWTVKVDAGVARESSTFGSCHHSTQIIYLDPNTTRQKQEQCFLHEVMHAVAWQSGLDRRMENAKQGELLEEIISSLSFGMYQVLKDNGLLTPEFVPPHTLIEQAGQYGAPPLTDAGPR